MKSKLIMMILKRKKNKMEIKASQVKELRDMTGVAMMECKKALVECSGDIEKALDLLRSNSALKAEKKAASVPAVAAPSKPSKKEAAKTESKSSSKEKAGKPAAKAE